MTRLIFAFTVFSLFFSCNQYKNKPLELPQDFESDFVSDWVVITEPYTKLFEHYSFNSAVTAFVRLGELYRIEGRKIELTNNKQRVFWYKLEDGWIQESSIKVYSSKARALKAVSELLKNNLQNSPEK